MSQGRLIVALDLGTTEFRALVTETTDSGELEIIGCAQEKAEGFLDGDFVDLAAGAQCIRRCIQKLEAVTEIYVSGFTYNITGSHLRSVRATAQIPITSGPRPIRESDLEEVRQRARSMAIPFDQKILTVTPVEYSVDRVRGITAPTGRVGSQLEIQAHLITGSRSVLNNIENAIETAKYKPLGEEVDVLAASRALLTQEERDQGVMLVDIGGTATSWAVFRRGAILTNGIVPFGGNNLTTDLSHGLRVPLDEAEKVKRSRGVALRSLVEEVSLGVLFEEERPEETPGLVAAILEPRLEEILTMVKDDFGDLNALAGLGAGVVLTGGGSRCQGTAQLCEEIFDLPVQDRYHCPQLLGSEELPDGQWATVAGLSLWTARDLVDDDGSGDPRSGGGLLGKIRGLFKRNDVPGELAAKG
jgi:cell division protein FtsA